MNPGDVILTSVPQANGVTKNRPAIFLREMPPYRDPLVCGVSTQLHQEVKDFDEVIQTSDLDFAGTGLRTNVTYPAWLPGSGISERHHWFHWKNIARKA